MARGRFNDTPTPQERGSVEGEGIGQGVPPPPLSAFMEEGMKAGYIMIPLKLTCPSCGKTHTRPASWRYGDFCSVDCYAALPFPRLYPHIKMADLDRVARLFICQKSAAKALGVSYVRFRRVVKKLDMRDNFAPLGGAATWGATWMQE